MITKKQYTVGKYTLIWEFDDSEQDVSKLILNNLLPSRHSEADVL